MKITVKELEELGFKQLNMRRFVLRKNDLTLSVFIGTARDTVQLENSQHAIPIRNCKTVEQLKGLIAVM